MLDGVQVGGLTQAAAAKLSLPKDAQGVVVLSVDAGSAAADKLRALDVIEQINHRAVASPDEYAELSRGLPEGEPVLLSVLRNQTRMFVVVNPS